MDYSVRGVPLSAIDASDHTFRITTAIDADDLVPSIASMGLLQPPLLVKHGDRYVIVCGFRRIAACRSIALDPVPARLDCDQPPGLHHARMAIADNACQRELNVVEQARALALIRRYTPNSENWRSSAASAGLPDNPQALDRLSRIADMPASLQAAIVSGRIAPTVAISINSLSGDDANVVADLIGHLNPGLNIQRELLELLSELAIIEETTIACLLERNNIAKIISDIELPLPQKVQHFRRELKKMRFPALSQADHAFHQALKALNINGAIQIQPSPFFEGNTFRLQLSVSSRRQLKSLLSDLEKIADHPHILPE